MNQNKPVYTLLLLAAVLLGVSVLLNVAGGVQLWQCKQENGTLIRAVAEAQEKEKEAREEAKKSNLESAVKENAVLFAEAYFTRDGNPLTDRAALLSPYCTENLLKQFQASVSYQPAREDGLCTAKAAGAYWTSTADGAEVLVLCRLTMKTNAGDAHSGVLLELKMEQDTKNGAWLVERILQSVPVNLPEYE